MDDDDDVRETLAEILAMRGFLVAKAGDGHEALKCAIDASPDIAILDVGLPGMDGYELARRLRVVAGVRADLLLIAVTGYGQQENRRLAHEAGFKLHLVKPFDLDVLAQALDDPVAAEF
ncbi:MAG TPA: response regulator [Polyangia bacterium]|nr:response regulator [Polyangia bacterium]